MLAHLSTLGTLLVSGPDSKKFLQGQLTCDLNGITEQKSSYGGHCNAKGRLLSNFLLLAWQQQFLLIMPLALIPIAKAALEKYALFSKATLNDTSDHWHVYGVFDKNIANVPISTWPSNPHQQAIINDNTIVTQLPDPNQPRWLISSCCPIINQQFAAQHHPQAEHAWHLSTLKSHFAQITPETSGLFTPANLNFDQFDHAVSLQKGCYTGQEVIARMHYLGKAKQGLFPLVFDTNKLLSSGDVLSCADSPRDPITIINAIIDNQQCIALGVLAHRLAEQLPFDVVLGNDDTPIACHQR